MRKTIREVEDDFKDLDHSECGPACPYAVGLTPEEQVQQAHILFAKALSRAATFEDTQPETWAELSRRGKNA